MDILFKNDDYAIIGGHVAAMETSMETLKREFEELLETFHMERSLSHKGCPYDNPELF